MRTVPPKLLKRESAVLSAVADLPAVGLPHVTVPVRLNDLPGILGPYAVTAPIFVYLMSCGNIKATRFRLRDDGDLILVLGPRGHVPQAN